MEHQIPRFAQITELGANRCVISDDAIVRRSKRGLRTVEGRCGSPRRALTPAVGQSNPRGGLGGGFGPQDSPVVHRARNDAPDQRDE